MTQSTAIQTTNTNTIQVNGQSSAPDTTERWSYLPPIDVLEWDSEFTIECDAPGLQAQDVSLTYEHGQLRLHAPVAPRCGQDVRFLSQEYGVGDFDRIIPLGRLAEFVDVDRITADYNNGVLTIRLPKLASAQARRVEVKIA